MPRQPTDPLQLVEKKNAAAVKLAAKGKLYQALDALNEAIRIAPNYPRSFLNRADVFTRLGMLPQAEADRRRAQQLGYQTSAASLTEELAPREPETANLEVTGTGSREIKMPWWWRLLEIPWWERLLDTVGVLGRGKWLRIVTGLIVLAGIAAGAAFALRSLEGGDEESGATATATSVATTTITATATAPSTPSPTITGSPFSFAALKNAWESRGIAVAVGGPSAGFSGLAASAFDVGLTKGPDALELSILIYGDPEAVTADWDLTPGQAPVLKAGRTLPDHVRIWWNQNIILLVRSASGDLSPEALDAFFALSP